MYHKGVGSAICYWIIIEKVNDLSRTTVQQLTAEEPIYTDAQERICDYHGSLEEALGSEDFGISLDVYDSFINNDEEGIAKVDSNDKGYQGLPDSPEIYETIDSRDEERAANYYDQ